MIKYTNQKNETFTCENSLILRINVFFENNLAIIEIRGFVETINRPFEGLNPSDDNMTNIDVLIFEGVSPKNAAELKTKVKDIVFSYFRTKRDFDFKVLKTELSKLFKEVI